ncbi:family 1 glycosylhydrolase [Chthonobacter albigriseus]|uniref:family 1 glycosylhydrolase n=1 Tax=Chthonobacter albigriseus TaxID=1683161 RepID=UPI0015EEECBA|nr:family 1 glycosylhydrolase [Chthonobacter albigriseus]
MNGAAAPEGIEIWGGVESTIARIGDDWRDQVFETGHQHRIEDLDAVAELGISALRYPVLWESLDPRHPHHRGWAWHDARLDRLRALGIRPIVGLVHHGSGPRGTDLLDPAFPEKLAAHAAAVAARYPWVGDYTPVNEPLTTARFSALYGHWYPHARDHRLFLKATLNQCRAVVLAMAAIRAVNPAARLIQTEDLGKTFARPGLAYQADFENERRFLSFDLLTGMVRRDHPLRHDLGLAGIGDAELDFFEENASPPDIFGMNHYLTSERFLDDRLDLHAAHHHGGNAFQRYADVEAVRSGIPDDDIGPKARLRDLWRRYGRPCAITEAHHGCSREEQLRWLKECHAAAVSVKAEGADVRAVTAWALFGVVDWSSLLTRRNGHYEPGAFDVRHDPPRRTAIGGLIRRLAGRSGDEHPVLEGTGWWHRPNRLYGHVPKPEPVLASAGRRILIVGAETSVFGAGLAQVCEVRGLHHVFRSDDAGLSGDLARGRIWAVVDIRAPEKVEADGTRLADLCGRRHVPYLLFSCEKVFDGSLARPYVESDPVAPRCDHGHFLAALERDSLTAHPAALVVRCGPILSAATPSHPVHRTIASLLGRGAGLAGAQPAASFSYGPDLAHAALDLLIDGASGLWHLVNDDEDDWNEIVERTAQRAGLDLGGWRDTDRARPSRAAVRLASERGQVMPSRESALGRFVASSGRILP